MRNKMLWTAPILALAIMIGGAIQTHAGMSESGRGWLWGGSDNSPSLGWVSMNNVDSSDNVVNGAVSYGVNIPLVDGAVTGYAWSENYGWISFNSGDLTGCPQSGATRSGDTLTGGARILSIRDGGANAGGWLGCVSLSGTVTDGASYGVTIDPVAGQLAGYAWSDELGWIDFSRAQVVAPKVLKICPPNPTMFQGSTQVLTLYYDERTDCSDVSKPAISASALVWSEADADNVLTLGDPSTNTPTISVTTVADGNTSSRTVTISATHAAGTATTVITVPGVSVACVCNPATVAATCSGTSFASTNTPSGCTIPATCSGSMLCGSKWKEVAPL